MYIEQNLKSLSRTDINGRFLFVPCQDPDLDVCLHQSLNGLWHLILQLVLYGCGPQQLQVLHSKWGENKQRKKRQSEQRKVFKTSHVKETCEPGLCHSLSHVSPHQLLLFITQKNHCGLLGVLDIPLCLCVVVWLCVCARMCACASAVTTSPIQARPHNTRCVFFPGNLVVLWGWLQARNGPKQGQVFDNTQG